MEAVTARRLPFASADGPHNMAADEVLLHAAAAGVLSFRCYGWTTCTVSLGYFQSQASRRSHPQLTSLPYLRRPTGGLTLVHHHELTYALALPADVNRSLPPARWLERVHQILADVLAEFGAEVDVARRDGEGSDDPLCFKHVTRGDLLIGADKVAGSAQRRHHGALLQHGAVLLARSPATPTLPGVAELAGRVLDAEALADAFGAELARRMYWQWHDRDWGEPEQEHIRRLVREKYQQPDWNDRR